MTFDIDREAHAVYDDALRLSRILTAEERTPGVLCRGCDKPVTVVYHEDRLYSVHCPRCGIVTLVTADSPEHAARSTEGQRLRGGQHMTLDEAIQHAREVAQSGCSECCKEHEQLADWLEELRDRRAAPDHEMISRKEAIEAVKHDLDWLGSRDGPAAVSALMRLRVFDPVYELNKRHPGYSVLPRDCIERTLRPDK